jgi:protein TonB
MSLQAGTPWAMTHEEDRLFRWILLQTLAVSLVIGVITPYIRLPQPEADMVQKPPPRRVKLLAERPLPAPIQAPSPTAPVAPEEMKPQPEPLPASLPEPQAAAKQTGPAPVTTPRQRAASSGVLAMADALRELQASKPRTGTTPTRAGTTARADTGSSQPSILAENITRGSGGIAGGVAHEAVLGATDLPEREASDRGKGLAGSGTQRSQTARAAAGNVRSQERIQEQLDRNKGAMYTLYNRELLKNASLEGKLVMSITIAPAGNVTRCVILSSDLDSASLEQQLVALISRMNFGNKPGAGPVTTRIPIEFFPQ